MGAMIREVAVAGRMIDRNRHGKKRRKRATGTRTATGRARQSQPDYQALAAAQPHRRVLPVGLRLSEKAGTVLGCLNLIGRVSDEEYEAGRRYGVLVAAYRSMIGTPNGIAGNGRGYGCLGSIPCPAKECECRMRTNRYQRAYEAISDAGRKAHMAINRVVVEGEWFYETEFVHLRAGLRELARHFGLGRS